EERYWRLRAKEGARTATYDDAYWREKDAEIERLRQLGDRPALVRALLDGYRIADAVAAARELTPQPKAAAADWALHAEAALLVGEIREALTAARKARALDPQTDLPAYLTGGLHTLLAHEGGAFGVAFFPDGRRLLSGGHDGRVRLW